MPNSPIYSEKNNGLNKIYMDPRKISSLHQILSSLGIHPKKSLSQNFLIEKNTLEKLISFANIAEGDFVLEIGPGLGAITLTLLEKGARVIAIELDHTLAQFLKKSIVNPNLTVIEGDFLTTSLNSFPSPMKLVANIPFQITSPILDRLALYRTLFSTIHLVVQKDLAIRMIAQKASAQNGPFSIFCQYYFTVKILSTISGANFYPKPSIDAAYIELVPKTTLPLENATLFFAFIHKLFHKKRKMIRSSISHPNLDEILARKGFSSTMRPQEFSLDDLLYIYKEIE